MELTLLWAALTGVALGWAGTRIWPDNLPDRPLDALLGAAVVGLFSGRLVAMVDQGVNPLSNPVDVILVRGGVHTGAASLSAIAALVWASRERLASLDALAPPALLALAGWHAGCLWRGACLGTASGLPWAFSQPGSPVSRHPTELYAFVGLAAAAWGVSRLPWSPFLRTGAALGLAGAVRLATEPIRPSLTGGPVGWYAAAVVVGGLVAVTAGARASRRAPPAAT